jgi:hypothetical protein
MLCEKVLPLLSEFFDEVLDPDLSVQVSQHLGQCIPCRKEFDSFAALRTKLRSVKRVQAPDYLRSLMQHRLTSEPWQERLKNELLRYWSIIRTTEAMWYTTRALGTVMSFLTFIMISSAITPYYIPADSPVNTTGWALLRPEVGASVLKSLGIPQLPLKTAGRSDPASVNDQTLNKVGQSISETDDYERITLLVGVDRDGLGTVESVVDHPNADSFKSNIGKVVSSIRFAPGRRNGEAIPSYVVLSFSKISVYD